MARTCGIRIGPRRYELLVLDGSAKKHKIVAFEMGEFPQGGEDPLGDAVATLKAAVKSSGAPVESVGIAIDTGLAAFRDIKLPDLDESKLEQVIKFEVEGELPQWNIDDVVIDFMKLDAASGETRLLVTAVPKVDLEREIEVCTRAGVEPLEVELEATAMVNAAMSADICRVDEAQVLVHVGETSTAVVVVDGGVLRSMRAIHIGALSHEPGKPSPGAEPDAPAAAMPEEAEAAEDSEADDLPLVIVDEEELKRMQEQAVRRIRRELGRTMSGARTANPIDAVYVCGWELPGLVGEPVLDVPVYELDVFEEDSGNPMEGAAPLVVPYGVALRQFGAAAVPARLRREELRYTGAFERVELPLAIAALLLVTLLAVFNIFELKQVKLRDADVNTWRESSNNFMVGYLDPMPKELADYLKRIEAENEPIAIETVDENGRTSVRDYNPQVDSDRSRLEQISYTAAILRREVKKLDDQLGNTGEVTQPQSALEGLTMVLGTLAELEGQIGRVAVREVDSQYQLGRSGKPDSVLVVLDLTFFADSTVRATENSEKFKNALDTKEWTVDVEMTNSSPFEEGELKGVTVDGFKVLCDFSNVPRAEEGQA